MLLIGCFGELSIILRVTIYIYTILYIIIFSTGINRPGVFCEYDILYYIILYYIILYYIIYIY